MTKRTLYTALLALFVGTLSGGPLQSQTRTQGIPVGQDQRASDQVGEPVTVRVTNNNWLDMRIYVVETTLGRRRWPLGTVTGLSTGRFEIPDHLRPELGSVILVAEAIGSRQRRFTDRLPTWPGALVAWSIESALRFSFATVS